MRVDSHSFTVEARARRRATVAGATAMLALFVVGAGIAAEKPALETRNDKVNYSVGYQIGGDFRRQGVELSPEALVRGVRDALGEKEPLLPKDEMWSTLSEMKKKMDLSERKQKSQRLAEDVAAGKAFLAENAKKQGVVSLESGLQYLVLSEGTGQSPKPNDNVTVRYRGTLIDGSEFDSTDRRGKPATFRVDDAIPGWRQALPLMKEGAKWKIFLPSRLAYDGRGPLEGKTVIFDLELVSVTPPR